MRIEGMGGMMGGMGLIGILAVIGLVLGIAALIKHLFLGNRVVEVDGGGCGSHRGP